MNSPRAILPIAPIPTYAGSAPLAAPVLAPAMPAALALALEAGHIPPVRPLPCLATQAEIVQHLKDWARAEVAMTLHGVGPAARMEFNP